MAQVEVRAARTEDRETVLAFCAQTWKWGDYIEREWDEWLHDEQGALLVCTTDGQPTGVVHLRMTSAIDAWLEGLRVDPAYREQGQATALTEAALLEAMRRGATYVRLVTDAENVAAQWVFERLHMRQVGGFVPFNAAPLVVAPKRISEDETTHIATKDDIDEIIDYLNVSNVFPSVGGLYYADFTAYVLTAELLEKQVEEEQIYLLRRWGRLDGLAIAEQKQSDFRGKHLSIGYIDGMTIEAISLIAYDLRRRLAPFGLERAFVYAPNLVLVRDGLTGIEYDWNGSVFLTYERGLT